MTPEDHDLETLGAIAPAKSVTPRFIGDDDAFGLTSSLNGLMTPSVHETGTIPATSELDWLISITTMSVLSWSRAVRERLRSFDCRMDALSDC